MGWHLQCLLDARQLPELARKLGRLQVPIVVDHMGHMPTAEGIDHPGFQTLLSLVKDGAWVEAFWRFPNLGGRDHPMLTPFLLPVH